MVHKRGLGSLPKGLEWIEPRLDLEENTAPEPAQEPLPTLKLVSTPFLKPITPVQAAAIASEEHETQKPEEMLEMSEASSSPKFSSSESPVASKPIPQKKTASTSMSAKIEEPENSASLKGLKEGWTRATFIVKEDQVEKLKAVAYWERLTVKEVIEEAFTLYLQNKNVRKIPVRSRN